MEKTIFIPLHVYEDWVMPILFDKTYIKNKLIEIVFYNQDEEGINCKVNGSEEVVSEFIASLLNLIEHATILYNHQKQINQ